MHGVIETPTFLKDAADAGMSEKERLEIVDSIAEEPTQGDLMEGTGGVRKVRFAGRGKGKSGGYRVVTYFAARDVPVLLLAIINKGERANLSKAERNELKKELQGFADDYRASVKHKATELKKRRKR
jgi:hypothetical protein